jgi:hypothetical protein
MHICFKIIKFLLDSTLLYTLLSLYRVRHPQHTQTCSNSSTIAADSSNGVTNTRVETGVCPPDDGWKYHSKHVEQFPDINCVTLHLVGYILEYY